MLAALLLTVEASRGDLSQNPAYTVAFGAPALVGSSNATHFWFPSSVLQLGAGKASAATVLQGVSRHGDGKTDAKSAAGMTLLTRDGGRTYSQVPASGPFPLLPESPLFSKRAQSLDNFSSINGFHCSNASCSGNVVRWHATPDAELKPVEYLPLRVSGVLPQLLSAVDGERPIKLRDGSILLATYGFASDAKLTCSKELPDHRCYSIFFFSLPDPAAHPTAWRYLSRIDHTDAMSERGATVEGPCEPAIVQLPGDDDRILSVFRVNSFTSHWAAISRTGGRDWGTPFPTKVTWAVSPNLLALRSGAVVLTSGRPGVGLWVTSFPDRGSDAHTWQYHDVLAAHNAGVSDPAHRYPAADASVQNASSHDSTWIVNAANPRGSRDMDLAASTSYTGLIALDDETLLLSYDRLSSGWRGPPGRLGDSDRVFAMRVTIKSDDDFPRCACANSTLCAPLQHGPPTKEIHVWSDCGGRWATPMHEGNSNATAGHCDWTTFPFDQITTIVRDAGHPICVSVNGDIQFDCEDPGVAMSGQLTTNWPDSPLVCHAHQHDVRVLASVLPNFKQRSADEHFYEHLMSNASAVRRMADNLAEAVLRAGFDGVEFVSQPLLVVLQH